jgi:hypothetical protein
MIRIWLFKYKGRYRRFFSPETDGVKSVQRNFFSIMLLNYLSTTFLTYILKIIFHRMAFKGALIDPCVISLINAAQPDSVRN